MSNGSSGVVYYPLDVSKLTKGQVLTLAELEPILGVSPTSRKWPLKLLNLRQKIETLRRGLGLPIFTFRVKRGELLVCDDSDASQYNRSMGKRGIKRFRRASVRNLAVDTSKLTDEERQTHERTVLRQAMMLAAIRGVMHKQPAIAAPQRTTPPMVSGPVETTR